MVDETGRKAASSRAVQDAVEDHDRGLAFDLVTLHRRRALMLLGGASLAVLTGCTTAGNSTGTTATAGSTAAGAGEGGCAVIPEETAGPFPANGSPGPDILDDEGIVRADLRRSFGSASGVADGVPLTVNLTVVDAGAGCAALPGAAVYLWHCDRQGRYSLYSDGVTQENFLRGVQVADSAGRLSFTTVFPGAYPGRWPHAHFEVYPSLADATSRARPRATSQLALPAEICRAVYETDGYTDSARVLDGMSLTSDLVFADSYRSQLATITGDVGSGLTAALSIRSS